MRHLDSISLILEQKVEFNTQIGGNQQKPFLTFHFLEVCERLVLVLWFVLCWIFEKVENQFKITPSVNLHI